jgi:hypothetical protein
MKESMDKEIEIVEPEASPEMPEEEIITIPRMTIPADARQLRDYGTMRDYLRIRWEEMQEERDAKKG